MPYVNFIPTIWYKDYEVEIPLTYTNKGTSEMKHQKGLTLVDLAATIVVIAALIIIFNEVVALWHSTSLHIIP